MLRSAILPENLYQSARLADAVMIYKIPRTKILFAQSKEINSIPKLPNKVKAQLMTEDKAPVSPFC